MASDRCRSCNAEIWWAVTEKGRRIPLDPHPVEGGNVRVERVPGRSTALAIMVEPDPSVMRYVTHFATCPNAHRHRKKERKNV